MAEATRWCAECGDEYRPGFDLCADYHVPLVAEQPKIAPSHRKPDSGRVVELTRVPPFEAEVIVARLRASGIRAALGPDAVYDSVTFADGIPVFVAADDAAWASTLLGASPEPGTARYQAHPCAGRLVMVEQEFGCPYCADQQNRNYGHVTQIAASDGMGSMLLRCPRCSTFYEVTEGVGSKTFRLTPDGVDERFHGAV